MNSRRLMSNTGLLLIGRASPNITAAAGRSAYHRQVCRSNPGPCLLPDDVSDVAERSHVGPIGTSRVINSCHLWRSEYLATLRFATLLEFSHCYRPCA